MTNLVWTKTPPTVPGYYFLRVLKGDKIMPGGIRAWYGTSEKFGIIPGNLEPHEWAGPIPEPQEPQGE